MEFDVMFQDDGPADIEITLAGDPTPESFVELNKRLTQDPRFRPGMTILADLAAVDTAELSDGGLQTLAAMVVERDWYHMPSAVAIVAPNEATHDVALSYRAHLGGSKSNRHVFHSRAEAVAWLEQRG